MGRSGKRRGGRAPRAARGALAARLALAALVAGSAAACGSAPDRPAVQTQAPTPTTTAGGGRYKVGKPYQIKGVWYYPAIDYDYVEEGVASWYGPGFHGKLTANGEVYDQNDMTAAHRTLPMPSLVRVTNLENGRSLKLTVNDRGPFARDRIIDVSRRAAQLLGFHAAGTTQVRVEILAEESRQLALALTGAEYPGQVQLASRTPPASEVGSVPPPAADWAPPPPMPDLAALPVEPLPIEPLPMDPLASEPVADQAMPADPPAAFDAQLRPVTAPAVIGAAGVGQAGRAWIQAGAFAEPGNAEKARAQLARLGPVAVLPAGRGLYRVRVGPLASLDDAERLLAAVIGSGFPGSHLVIE
jgi:rare lipoprotein A